MANVKNINDSKTLNFRMDTALKTLSIAALAGCTFIYAPQANAETPAAEESETHAYNLTKVEADGQNVLKMALYDETQNQILDEYYALSLDKTTYGKTTGDLATAAYTVNGVNGGTFNVNYKYPRYYGTGSNTNSYTVNGVGNITANFDTYASSTSAYNLSSRYGSADVSRYFYNIPDGAVNSGGSSSSNNYISASTGDVIADFVNSSNRAIRNSSYAYNSSSGSVTAISRIGNITGDFIGNRMNSSVYVTGGAISNYAYRTSHYNYLTSIAEIGNIKGDFVGNYVRGRSAQGGAIYNEAAGEGTYSSVTTTAKIGNITGNFVANHAEATDLQASGGAISNGSSGGGTFLTLEIGDITGDFIGNYAKTRSSYYSSDTAAYGGAIYNYIQNPSYSSFSSNSTAKIGDIKGDFVGNYAEGYTASGGAIYNSNSGPFTGFSSGHSVTTLSHIGNITGDFIGNYVNASSSIASGGAISNSTSSGGGTYITAEIGNITGDFIANYAKSNSGSAYGGAIYNYGLNKSCENYSRSNSIIGNIIGNFIGNYAEASGSTSGGAIYNRASTENPHFSTSAPMQQVATAQIGDIRGDFIGNYAKSSNSAATTYGGAIYNSAFSDSTTSSTTLQSQTAQIGNIKGDFIGNYVINTATTSSYYDSSYAAGGGAIYNVALNRHFDNSSASSITTIAKIGNIEGDFVNNYALVNYRTAIGGAITNSASSGGGTYITAEIGNITGDFIGNYAKSANSSAKGGAIYNEAYVDTYSNNVSYTNNRLQERTAEIGNITGDFIGNYAEGYSDTYGGAIYNKAYTYTSNSKSGSVRKATAKIGDINGSFIGNYAKSSKNSAKGGAIYNSLGWSSSNTSGITQSVIAKIGNIKGNLIGNYASGSSALGGAIYNEYATIGDISGDIMNNYAKATNGAAYGGAIYNSGTTGPVNSIASIGNISGNIIGNYAEASGAASGGAIYMGGGYSDIASISGNIMSNHVQSNNGTASGGAIYAGNYQGLPSITGNIVDNYAKGTSAYGGAIYDSSSNYGIPSISGDIIGNHVQATNGTAKGGAIYGGSSYDTRSISGNIIGNYAKASNGTAQGGAIYNTRTVNLLADNRQNIIAGNYTEDKNGKDDNAIYMDSTSSKLIFDMKNGGSFVLMDNVRGKTSTSTVTNADGEKETKTLSYVVTVKGDNVDNTKFHWFNQMHDATLNVGNTSLNTINDSVTAYKVNKFTLTGDTNMAVDVDLENQVMDRIEANEYGVHNGTLNVNGMNVVLDAPKNRNVTEVYFAQPGLKDNVTNGIPEDGELPQDGFQTTAYSPIYKYNVTYDNREDGGYFMFAKGGSETGNPSDSFNPAVLSTPVAMQAASNATINETFKYVFEHVDAFTQLPYLERLSKIKANQYALSTDFNSNLDTYGGLAPEFENKAGWVKPYVTFETMDIKNGPNVNATTYGTLVGFDTDFQNLKRGWIGLTTGYLGYNGSQLHYSGVDTDMNGGLLGLTQTFYKNNFWSALTLTAGASVGETHNRYGKEDFTSLIAGIGSKSGYNFEFKEGRYIIQPIWFMSYTFANTFDYTNSAGVKIDVDPMHSIQLNPSVRFITNTKNGWQPYASVGMVWNIMNHNSVSANGVKLPEMGMKPYVEYGLGAQKRFKDNYTAFGQAMIRNGGRNGIALTFGFRWNIGKQEPVKNVKRYTPKNANVAKPNRKVLRQLSPSQYQALVAKYSNSATNTKARTQKKL